MKLQCEGARQYTNSKYWVGVDDFSFYRMDVVDVYYVGGFGVMGWVLPRNITARSLTRWLRLQPRLSNT
jgi:hypothetical protein